MSMKAKTHSTAGTEENHDQDFDFVQVGDKPIANVQNNSHDNPQEHIYSVAFDIERVETGITVRAISCSCPSDTYHDGPCKHRQAATDALELLAKMLLAYEQAH